MKNNYSYLLILIPATCAVFALSGWGSVFRYGVTASCMVLLLPFLFKGGMKKSAWLILAAFLFSIAGDWFLGHRHNMPVRFIYGILLYFFAHTGFLFYSLLNGSLNKKVLWPVLCVYIVFFVLALYPNIDEPVLLCCVFGYLVISCLSLAAAAGIHVVAWAKYVFVAGIALILFSDTIIACNEFSAYKILSFLIMPTYYASHVLITLALMGIMKTPGPSTSSGYAR
jgi:hypothetical protein